MSGGAVSGLGIATVGIWLESLWIGAVYRFSWPASIWPEMLAMAIPAAVLVGACGAMVGMVLTNQQLPRRAISGGLVVLAVLAIAANNASAQQDTAPQAQHGPAQVFVTGLFPNGGTPPPQDPIGTRFEGNKSAIAAGKELFGQMNCTGCHFNGGGGMGPALMSGHWRYGGRIDQIYASIAQGRPNGMPWSERKPAALEVEISARRTR